MNTATTTTPLIKALNRRVNVPCGDSTLEQIVLKHGTSFKGIDRPKGMRLGPSKDCYRNSYHAAGRHEGMLYVEGFAMVRDHFPFQHAWISPDGTHAIDLTIRYPPSEIQFFGIAFSIGKATTELVETDATLPLFCLWKPPSRLHALAEKATSRTAMNDPCAPGV